MGVRDTIAARADLNNGAVCVPLRRIGNRPPRVLRLGTLGWSATEAMSGYLTNDEFVRTVTAAKPNVDLLLCAGRSVLAAPKQRELLRASGNEPVLFEVAPEQWWLVQSASALMVRARQLLAKHDAPRENREALARTLKAGRGTICLPNTNTYLNLMICGENNILSLTGSSVLKDGRPWAAKTKSLQGEWLLLNPAHRPYRAPSRSAGAAKARSVDGYSPVFQRLTGRERPYRDGTRAPVAVVYVNNYLPGKRWTRDIAGVVFHQGKQIQPSRCVPARPDANLGFEYREFQLHLR